MNAIEKVLKAAGFTETPGMLRDGSVWTRGATAEPDDALDQIEVVTATEAWQAFDCVAARHGQKPEIASGIGAESLEAYLATRRLGWQYRVQA